MSKGRLVRLTESLDLFYSHSEMFDEIKDLSPDLEWMLQSYQVDDDTLIESLARQYYQHIYNLALSMLSHPEKAHRAARETFVQAVIQADDYRGEVKIDA